jgi:hypothetical protein
MAIGQQQQVAKAPQLAAAQKQQQLQQQAPKVVGRLASSVLAVYAAGAVLCSLWLLVTLAGYVVYFGEAARGRGAVRQPRYLARSRR